MSTHLDRKELKQPDAFVTKTTGVFSVLQNNAKAMVGLLVVAIVAVSGFIVYRNSKSDHEVQVANAFYPIRKSAVTELAKVAKDADWETKAKDSLSALSTFAEKNKATSAGFEASVMLATTYFDHANFEKASSYFEAAVKNAPTKTLEATANYQLAYTYENLKKYDLALALHEKVQASGIKMVTADSLLSMGRIAELKGDKKKALEYFEKFNKEYPESTQRKTIDATISRLKK